MVSLAIGLLALSLLWLKSNTGTQITSHGGAALCYSSVQCQRAAILLCQNKRLCLCVSLCNCQCLYVVCNFKTESRAVWEKKKACITLQWSPANTIASHTNMPHRRSDFAIFRQPHPELQRQTKPVGQCTTDRGCIFCEIKGTAPPNERHWTLSIYKNCWTFFMYYIAQEVCFQRLDFDKYPIHVQCNAIFFSLWQTFPWAWSRMKSNH